MPDDGQEQFLARLDALCNDAFACARYAYTQLTIDSSTEAELRQFLNSHALFWNTVRSALQAAAIISLGRIYDRNRDTNAAERTLRFAEQRPGLFSRDLLRARKIHADGLSEADAAAFVENAFEPRQEGFAALRARFDEMQEVYQESVKDIRHGVFAHAGRLARAERDELFENLKIRGFERLVVFPLQLWDALFNLYWNGIEPIVRDAPTVVSEVIAAGAPNGTSTWEHQHSAASTVALLEELRPLYPELYDPE